MSEEIYTDHEINQLSEWMESLTIEQLFWLKDFHEDFMKMKLVHEESPHVH